jgi:Kazal-type serine protease inhibitor domain
MRLTYPCDRSAVLSDAGKCVRKEANCPGVENEVCGCDNKTYASDCERIKAGQLKRHDQKCKK